MFSPKGMELERGWPGRLGDHQVEAIQAGFDRQFLARSEPEHAFGGEGEPFGGRRHGGRFVTRDDEGEGFLTARRNQARGNTCID